MKKLQVMIEDELMFDLKTHALNNGTTLKDITIAAIQNYLNPNPITHKEPKKEETIVDMTKGVSPVIVADDDQTEGGLFHLVPKTAKIGKPLKVSVQLNEGPITWMVFEGERVHYDKDGKAIPFRCTDDKGNVQEPDIDELGELSEYYGKPVELEI